MIENIIGGFIGMVLGGTVVVLAVWATRYLTDRRAKRESAQLGSEEQRKHVLLVGVVKLRPGQHTWRN